MVVLVVVVLVLVVVVLGMVVLVVVVLELVVLVVVVLELVVLELVVLGLVVLELVLELDDVVVVELVVVVDAGVTTSCGPLDCARDVKSAPFEPLGFDSTKAKVPFPVTVPVTSNSTQVLAGRLAAVPTSAALAGAFFQVRPFSVQPVPVPWSVAPWVEPFDATRTRSLALPTGALRPVTVNLRYDDTAAVDDCSTRSAPVA
jgi:hypothetical protein